MNIENTEISIIPTKENSLAVFTADNGLDPFLSRIREEIDSFKVSFELDMSKPADRKKVSSMAHKIARSKTALDDAGKELTAKLKEMPRKVDAERKRMRDLLDEWKEEVRHPLTNWELLEEDRIATIQARIEAIQYYGTMTFFESAQIKTHLANLKSIDIDDSFCEFKEEAEAVKNKCLVFLQDCLEKKLAYEVEEAERQRIEEERRIEAAKKAEEERIEREKQAEIERKAREERIAQEAKKRAEEEAAQKATQEKEAAECRERELKLEAERARREALEAEERAKRIAIETEERIKREAEETARLAEEERRAREADQKHRREVHLSIISDLIHEGIDEENAKKVCSLLAQDVIGYVKIVY